MEPPGLDGLVKEVAIAEATLDNSCSDEHLKNVEHKDMTVTGLEGAAAVFDPTSCEEEPGPVSEEEEEEEAKEKENKQALTQDSERVVDQEKSEFDSEYLSTIHTCYHNSFFLLRMPVTVGGKPVEIQLHKGSPVLTCQHSGQELSVSLSAVSCIVAPLLLKHGVYHVDTFYYERVPLFSVVFSSKASLKKFLSLASKLVKVELESAIGEAFAKQLKPEVTASSSHLCQLEVSLDIELYLITPDRQKNGSADAQLVTLSSYSHYSEEWQRSRMFEFVHLFQSAFQGGFNKDEVECAELKDLVNDLKPVTDWFKLGVNLDIPAQNLLEIEHDHRSLDDRRTHMLIAWEKRERRTWSKVIRALTAIGREVLAQELATKYYGAAVPITQSDSTSTVPLPAVPKPSGSERTGYQSMMVPSVEANICVDAEFELKQIEKQLNSTEVRLKEYQASRGVVKQAISESIKSLQQLPTQLQRVIKEINDIQVKLEKKKKKCEDLHRLQERYKKMWKSDVRLLEETIEEKEQEVKELEAELELKETESQTLKRNLFQVQENLRIRTTELDKKTTQVVELESEVEQLTVKLSNKGKELDMELQQTTARATSQSAYIGEMKLHVSSMQEEILTKEKEIDNFRERMTEKEDKITRLSESLQSQSIQMEILEKELKRGIIGAQSTADTVQNLTKADELIGLGISVSQFATELDEANREKHRLMLKKEIAYQETKRLQESIRKLKSTIPDPSKCRAVGAGLESAQKHQLAKFEIHVADEDGEPCTGNDGVIITVEVKSISDQFPVTSNVVSKTPALYEVSYRPIKCGEHEICIKVNGAPISSSPFAVLVCNIPHPKNCKAVGEQVENAEKNRSAKFMVQLADAEGDPCLTVQEVTVELKSLMDGSVISTFIVSKTPATYDVSYLPSRRGEHELSVKVNGMEISGSPFALLVHNIPHPQNCKAIGEGITTAEKCKCSKFIVHLADEEGDPCVSKQEVIAELKSLVDGSITKGSIVNKTPATYEASYQPSKSGEHELSVKVNGIQINGSPFVLLVHNIPQPQNCKAFGKGIKEPVKNELATFTVQLADAEGDPCVTKQEVTADLKSLTNDAITKADTASKTPATYDVSYHPSRGGEHELSVKVNGMEISGSPFTLLVHNIPHPQNCKAIGEGITKAEKWKHSKFIVQLADAEGDPCVSEQEVIVECKSPVDSSTTKADIVSKTPATYEVSYQPSKSGIHALSVKVNGMHIEGSPFALLVVNMPHMKTCKAMGKHVKNAEKNKAAKFVVQLADAEGEPCVSKQEITVELKRLLDGSTTKGSIVSKTPATYEASYEPSKSGEHELSVKVNGIQINDSPFTLLVHNIPQPQNCMAFGKGIKEPVKNELATFTVQLADAEGDPCVTKQEVTAELKSLTDDAVTKADTASKTPASYDVSYLPSRCGEHELSVKVNGMEINGSPFILLVHNIPHPHNCKAIGEGITKAEKCKHSKFLVHLADEEGDPCVSKQEVIVELKSLVDGSVTKADVVSETPATYEVTYQPSKNGEHELSVKVNDISIEGSPFALHIIDIPDSQNYEALGEGIKIGKESEFIVHLADAEDNPCLTEVDGSYTKINAVSKAPATHEATYHPGPGELVPKATTIGSLFDDVELDDLFSFSASTVKKTSSAKGEDKKSKMASSLPNIREERNILFLQKQLVEEQKLRQDLQVKLLQTEQQLRQLKMSLGNAFVANGPASDFSDGAGSEFSPILERDTCRMQIPKGHNPRKQGWKDVFMVMSFTMKKLLIYEGEEMEADPPITTFEFGQVYTVRTLRPGEHETVRVRQSNIKKILMLSYIEQQSSETQQLFHISSHEEVTVNYRGHQFVEISYHVPSNCDVCNKTLPWSLNIIRREVSCECKRCHLKCHKEHIDVGEAALQPCVGGERDVKRMLLLIKNDEDRERWLNQLSRITLAREGFHRPPSPSMRLRKRPSSGANHSSNLASNAPQRTMSISAQRQAETQPTPRNYAAYTGSGSQIRHPLPVELLRNSDWQDEDSLRPPVSTLDNSRFDSGKENLFLQKQLVEEQKLCQDVQVKLLQSEQQLRQLKMSLGNAFVTNRPASDFSDGAGSEFSPILERDTCRIQIPKGHNARKQGWKDVFMVMSFTMKKLLIYEQEEIEIDPPITTFEFGQVYTVRTLRPGEHEAVRVRQSNTKKILVLSYIEQPSSETQKPFHISSYEGLTVNYRGHQFVEVSCHAPSNCDVCNKTLPWSINIIRKGKVSYKCRRCHLNCHKEHVVVGETAMQPCVGGERDVKRVLLLIKNDEDRERWLNQLSRITLAREGFHRPPSPSNSSTRRGRLLNRPSHGANRFPNLVSNAPQRTMSTDVHRQTASTKDWLKHMNSGKGPGTKSKSMDFSLWHDHEPKQTNFVRYWSLPAISTLAYQCEVIAEDLCKPNPQDYALFTAVNGQANMMEDHERPQEIKLQWALECSVGHSTQKPSSRFIAFKLRTPQIKGYGEALLH